MQKSRRLKFKEANINIYLSITDLSIFHLMSHTNGVLIEENRKIRNMYVLRPSSFHLAWKSSTLEKRQLAV